MYLEYFGFHRFPFTIAPDPDFLFPTIGHREALAHLHYALTGLGGLICLTGEVGTGKTTLCRSFLSQVPAGVKTAYIFNPQLSSVELLQNICDELDVDYQGSSSLRDLYRYLNGALLSEYAQGHQVICVIDEAQAMPAELLEQVRLLTNLETSSGKLLTLILVGQPELQDTLQRYDLRQLNQRITARYHLKNLTLAETTAYINHRTQLAGVDKPLFLPAAVRRIWKAGNGVPRMINTLADRALLGAYAREQAVVSSALVAGAEKEIFGNRESGSQHQQKAVAGSHSGWIWLLSGFAGLILITALALGGFFLLQTQSWQRWFATTDNPVALLSKRVLGQTFDGCDELIGSGYECLWVDWSLADIQVARQAAALRFRDGSGDFRWQLADQQANGDYSGQALILWQPPSGYQGGLVKPGDRADVVLWVRSQLGVNWGADWKVVSPAGESVQADARFYDPLLATEIAAFQRTNGLTADRIIGPQTLFVLQSQSRGDS